VFTNSRIDLGGGPSNVDGVAFTIDGSIENAVSGDGADTLIGSAASNRLSGYRGRDSLSGAGSADTIDGGSEADTIDGGTGADSLFGGPGVDLLSHGVGSSEFMHGGSGVDTGDWSFSTGDSWDIDLVAGEARIGINVIADLVSIENRAAPAATASMAATASTAPTTPARRPSPST
jgi:Ca2+-binding RTX toxin-like protein